MLSQAYAPFAQEAGESSEADRAWKEVVKATQPPPPPEDWDKKQPTQEDLQAFYARNAELAFEAAQQAKQFAEKFPEHPKAEEAQQKHQEMLKIAANLGNEKAADLISNAEEQQLAESDLGSEERFQILFNKVQREAMSHQAEGMQAVLSALEKGARDLQKQFPARPEPYQLLLMIASNSGGESAKQIAKEIIDSKNAPQEIKSQAEGIVERMEMLGNPLDLTFHTLAGKEISLQEDLKGKVVLIDFWATWCGPCIAELPNVKAAYDKLHPKGFEILGISFDNSRAKLEQFLEEREITWPQYFDGKGWQNELGQRFGISSIPTMWLVDKKGIVRDMNARGNLEAKVSALLKE